MVVAAANSVARRLRPWSLRTSCDVEARGRPKHNHNQNLPKKFASDATPKWHLMAHQMKNLCGFSVFHCVEGAFGASSGGTPKMKNGAPRDELKNGRGLGWGRPLEANPRNRAIVMLFCCLQRGKNTCDFCNRMVASPTRGSRSRCDFAMLALCRSGSWLCPSDGDPMDFVVVVSRHETSYILWPETVFDHDCL